MVPEPPDTRMQVIKGFSELNFNYLRHLLPSPAGRKPLMLFWPKWLGDRWRFGWHQVADETLDGLGPLVAFAELKPDGGAQLHLFSTHETPSVPVETKTLTRQFENELAAADLVPAPIHRYFHAFGNDQELMTALVEHLITATRISPRSKDEQEVQDNAG